MYIYTHIRPSCLSLWGPLRDTPSNRQKLCMAPCKAPKGTNTKVASAKGHFWAYPMRTTRACP